jgi:hypothetical protein
MKTTRSAFEPGNDRAIGGEHKGRPKAARRGGHGVAPGQMSQFGSWHLVPARHIPLRDVSQINRRQCRIRRNLP